MKPAEFQYVPPKYIWGHVLLAKQAEEEGVIQEDQPDLTLKVKNDLLGLTMNYLK